MSFSGLGSSGFAGAGSARFATTRGRIQGAPTQGVNYPHPFFDIAHTYLPVTVKQLFRWCRYYFLTNPLINATVFKLSEYPITDIVVEHADPKVRSIWTEYFQEHLRYRPFQIECGLDYHCFHGDVKAVTEDGVFRLRDLVGQTVQVLSQDGVYRPAKFIESLTEQELLEVEFWDGSTVLTTPEHQWPTLTSSGNIKKVPTTDLEGKFIPRNVAARPEKNEEFYEGVRHGFVFGDGTLYNGGKQAKACFFGDKDKHMLKYFEDCGSPPYTESRGHVFIHGMPPHYKKMPENAATASYWYGFLCGFLAADGSVDVAGCAVLTQRSKTVLETIAAQLPRIGVVAGRVRGYEESTEYGEGTTYVLSLFKQYMSEQDFLLPHHARNFKDNYKPTNYGKRLRVKDVKKTGLFEKVYCCLEEETNTFTIDNGVLTGNTYGNCMTSLGFPFKKYLKCQNCSFTEKAEKIRASWTFTNLTFRLTCPKCQTTAEAESTDYYYKDANGINPIRWNCEHIEVTYNDVTGESTYFYTIPPTVRNDVVIGKKDVVESVPQVFIQAMREKKGVVFSKNNFFHMKRPTLAQQDRGWGTPIVLPVLKDTFYLQLMKKAQEAILLEHIVPLRVLFPQAGSGSSDPYTTINLTNWRDHVAAEIARWRQDNNYIPIMPLPIGNQTIGGDGRALMLTQEIQTWSEHLMSGLGVPREFLMGGLSYSGSNVSMRMLENQFIGFILRHKQQANWIMKQVAHYMDWPEATIRFKPFKMADDIQRKAYLFQLNQAQKISDTTLLADADISGEDEDEIMIKETSRRLEASKKQQLAMAEIQGEAQVVMAKSQAKAQQTMMEAQQAPVAPGEPGEQGAMGQMASPLNMQQSQGLAPAQGGQAAAGMDIHQMAQQLAESYIQLPPEQQRLALDNMRAQSPELANLVMQYAKQLKSTMPGAQQPQGAVQQSVSQVDMRPQPEQLPARRAAAAV